MPYDSCVKLKVAVQRQIHLENRPYTLLVHDRCMIIETSIIIQKFGTSPKHVCLHSSTIYRYSSLCTSYTSLPKYKPAIAAMTVSIAGIGPFSNLGSEDKNNRTAVPGTDYLGLSISRGLWASSAIQLTKCSLKPVDYVLVDVIPAGQVDGTNTTRDAEGGRTLVIKQTQILW